MLDDPHRAELLDKQKQDGNEHLIALEEGKVISRWTSGNTVKVAFSDELERRLDDPKAKIKVMHNHPGDSPFSAKDIETFRDSPGMAELTAEGATRSFSIKRTKTTEQINVNDVDSFQATAIKILKPLVWKGQLDTEAAGRAIPHAYVLRLHKRGQVIYTWAGNMAKEEKIVDDYL